MFLYLYKSLLILLIVVTIVIFQLPFLSIGLRPLYYIKEKIKISLKFGRSLTINI